MGIGRLFAAVLRSVEGRLGELSGGIGSRRHK